MNRGWIINGGNTSESIERAAASAMTIRMNSTYPVAVFLDSVKKWPTKYEDCVDYVIEYPFEDTAGQMPYSQLNQWQFYHSTPFDENMVLENDTMVLGSEDSLWDSVEKYNVQLGRVTIDFRRAPFHGPQFQWFEINDLRPVCAGLWYFQKTDESLSYFKMLDIVCQHWREVFKKYFKPEHVPEIPHLDVLHSIAVHMLDEYENLTVSNDRFLRYTDIVSQPDVKWNDILNTWYTTHFKIDNYRIDGVLKYNEPTVLNQVILNGIRDHYRSTQ